MTKQRTGRTPTNVDTTQAQRQSTASSSYDERLATPPGANPDLALAVHQINLRKYRARGGMTFCNRAFDAYAKQHGYSQLDGLLANQMFKLMAKPENGWRRATADEAIAAAAQGKLVAAAWYNNTPRRGRPDGRAPGHIAAVVGQYAPGVPGVAQAGRTTFEWGPITDVDLPDPTYFVLQARWAPRPDQPAVSRAPRRREP